MKVEVETIGPCRKALKIEIPAEEVNTELEKSYEEVKKNVQVPGFRKGKAPKSILKARFGDYLKAEALQNLIPSVYEKAVQEEHLVPLGEVEFKPELSEIELKENEPIRFEAIVDVKPKIELPDFQLIEIDKRSVDVPKEEVEKYVASLREQKADYLPIEEVRSAQNGDCVKVYLEAIVDGKPIESEKNEELIIEIGSRKHLADIEDGTIDMKPGDSKEIRVSFPQDHRDSKVAGKEVIFKVSLITITQKKLPELNDDFAKDLGYDNYDQFFSKTWNELVEIEKLNLRQRQIEEAVAQLLEKCQFEIPEALVETHTKHMIDDLSLRLRREEKSLEESGLDSQKLREQFRSEAINQIKRTWIFDEVALREDIEVSEDEVDIAIRRIAESQSQKRDPLKYVDLFKASPNRVEELKINLRDRKIHDILIERASAKRAIIA